MVGAHHIPDGGFPYHFEYRPPGHYKWTIHNVCGRKNKGYRTTDPTTHHHQQQQTPPKHHQQQHCAISTGYFWSTIVVMSTRAVHEAISHVTPSWAIAWKSRRAENGSLLITRNRRRMYCLHGHNWPTRNPLDFKIVNSGLHTWSL